MAEPNRMLILLYRCLRGLIFNSKTYCLFDSDDLATSPILLLLALALDDDAFKPSNLKIPEEIFRLKVKAPKKSYRLPWKDSKLNTPVFRAAVKTKDGIRTSEKQALGYDNYHSNLKRTGRTTGFEQILASYCVRRGTGNAIDGMLGLLGR